MTSASQVILKSNRKPHKQTETNNKQKKQSYLTRTNNKNICGKTSASDKPNLTKKRGEKNNTNKLKKNNS